MLSSTVTPMIYVHSDIPEGMTLAEWGRRDAVPRSPSPLPGFTRWARPGRRRNR
jgi:hypothetical protein